MLSPETPYLQLCLWIKMRLLLCVKVTEILQARRGCVIPTDIISHSKVSDRI